jgi:hypothetical protein
MPVDVVCAVCGDVFSTNPSKAASRKTCGRDCKKVFLSWVMQDKINNKEKGHMEITIDYRKNHKPTQRRKLINTFEAVGFKVIESKPMFDDIQADCGNEEHFAVIGTLLANEAVSSYTLSKDD